VCGLAICPAPLCQHIHARHPRTQALTLTVFTLCPTQDPGIQSLVGRRKAIDE